MSFINWGNSEEMRRMQRQLEEQAIYEQAARMARARAEAKKNAGSNGKIPQAVSNYVENDYVEGDYLD
jgi:hypothetical protein